MEFLDGGWQAILLYLVAIIFVLFLSRYFVWWFFGIYDHFDRQDKIIELLGSIEKKLDNDDSANNETINEKME